MSESNQKYKMGKGPKQEESSGSDSDGPVDDSEITPAGEVDEITEGVAGLNLPEDTEEMICFPPNLWIPKSVNEKLTKQIMGLHTQKLTACVFTKEELATSTLTQRSRNRERQQLDEEKVKNIIDAIKEKYPGTTDEEVKAAIQKKCNNEEGNANKPAKRAAKRDEERNAKRDEERDAERDAERDEERDAERDAERDEERDAERDEDRDF